MLRGKLNLKVYTYGALILNEDSLSLPLPLSTPTGLTTTVLTQYVFCDDNKTMAPHCTVRIPQWGAADAGIKVPSGENAELKHSPFTA